MTGYFSQSAKPQGSFKRRIIALGALLVCSLWLMQGCTGEQPAAKPGAQISAGENCAISPDAQGWFGSAEELVRAVSLALSASDRAALDRFCITREEYLQLVWPQLPVSKIEQWKKQSGFIWTQHAAKSDSGLRQLLANYGGLRLAVRSVAFTTPAQEYDGAFRLHVRPAIAATDQSGAGMAPTLFGSLIERSGRFKVFSYSLRQ